MKYLNLSVIIPVYNSAPYLARCLDSLLAQTLPDMELICINDGSTDCSLDILRQYESKYPNIVVLDQENSGPSVARNAGLAVARGEYVAFVDSDDYVETDMYEILFSVAQTHDLNVVICNYINDYIDQPCVPAEIILPNGCILDKNDIKTLIYPELMKDSVFNGPCNKIYRRDFMLFLDAKMPENLKYGEDLIFQLEVYDKLEKTYFVNIPFYHYVHRTNSLSTANRNMLESTLIPMYLIRKKYANNWHISEETTAGYFVYYALMDMVNTIQDAPALRKAKTLSTYLQNPVFSQALAKANLLAGDYTPKIKLLFLICCILRKRIS